MITVSTSARLSANVSIAQRIARLATALTLFVALSVGMSLGSVRTAGLSIEFLPGHSYVHYTTNHILSPSGDVVELNATNTNDGHVFDLYGNQVNYNMDGTISDVNNVVVGFVYVAAP